MKKGLILLPLVTLALGSCGNSEKKYLDQLEAPKEFEGYKLVGEPEDGHTYLFGYYNVDTEEMRFIDGGMHTDQNGEYPYYMSTTENTTDGAAEVEINYVDKTHFTMKVIADEGDYWNDKYMCIYPATSSYSNSVYSLKPVEDPEDIGADEFTHFEYMVSYNECPVCSAVIMLQDTRLDEEEEMPRVFGAATEFISLDCSASDEIENDSYCIAHFYEK